MPQLDVSEERLLLLRRRDVLERGGVQRARLLRLVQRPHQPRRQPFTSQPQHSLPHRLAQLHVARLGSKGQHKRIRRSGRVAAALSRGAQTVPRLAAFGGELAGSRRIGDCRLVPPCPVVRDGTIAEEEGVNVAARLQVDALRVPALGE